MARKKIKKIILLILFFTCNPLFAEETDMTKYDNFNIISEIGNYINRSNQTLFLVGDPNLTKYIYTSDEYIILHNPEYLSYDLMKLEATRHCSKNNKNHDFFRELGFYTGYFTCGRKDISFLNMTTEESIQRSDNFIFEIRQKFIEQLNKLEIVADKNNKEKIFKEYMSNQFKFKHYKWQQSEDIASERENYRWEKRTEIWKRKAEHNLEKENYKFKEKVDIQIKINLYMCTELERLFNMNSEYVKEDNFVYSCMYEKMIKSSIISNNIYTQSNSDTSPSR
jgi:hypothetical protein